MHCVKCHRPMKHASASGMGPVCEKRCQPAPAKVDRDLFGFDIDKAAEAALYRVNVLIRAMASEAHIANRRAYRDAMARLRGRWA